MMYQAPVCIAVELVPEAGVLQASPLKFFGYFPGTTEDDGGATLEGLNYENLP